MNTIIVHADSKVSKALIVIFKALNLSYEVKKDNTKEESTYDAAFVKMVMKRAQSAKEGNTISINPNDVWESLGLK